MRNSSHTIKRGFLLCLILTNSVGVWSDEIYEPAINNDDFYAVNCRWWQSFGDPVLDSLVSMGEAANPNVVMAARRIDIARSQLGMARSNYMPSVALGAGWQRSRSSGMIAPEGGSASVTSFFEGSATMNWEIDLFGKVRSQVRKAGEEVKVSAAEYGATLVALDAQIASTYVNLMVQKQQLAVANAHTESQKHIVDITEVRHRTGLASKLDVAQAKTLYYSTKASVPLLESSIAASYNALATLLGVAPEQLPAGIYTSDSIPQYFRLVSFDAPLEIVERRPDIVAARRSLEAAAAAVGVAKSDYLPSLSVAASIGTEAHSVGDLFKRQSITYSVAPTLSWTVFDGLYRRNNVIQARRTMEVEEQNYRMAVLTAIEEVRNAVSRYNAELSYIEAVREVVENSRESVNLSVSLYKEGLSSFTNVVDAQLNYLTYQNTLIEARGNAVSALIDLYKALGGGWAE